METRVFFDDTAQTLCTTVSLEKLSRADKVALLHWLLWELGIFRQFHKERDATARAQDIITERMNIYRQPHSGFQIDRLSMAVEEETK